ncbi:NAD(P)/FAD-dependent oxidoreductase [Streptomyces sp. NPDC020141]|uniref:NAD(P)/FAD-dependent oxidoreductase n=1 Tax=Streptomyces sp. NPDC020141 TaxID=3365065 RepID=UPI003796DD6C
MSDHDVTNEISGPDATGADAFGNSATGRTGEDGDFRYDAAVIGAGAAGLSAALVLSRARLRVAVVDAGQPRNAPAATLRGFLSRDGMAPAALLAAGRAEAAGYGAHLVDARADRVAAVPGGFSVRLAGGAGLTARRVLVATGLRDELPDLPGVREQWGKGLLHCPYCHGHEVADRPLGVLGTHPGAVGQALLLRHWSPDVILFAHTLELTGDDRERLEARGVAVAEGRVERLATDGGRLYGVGLADGRTAPREAVFVVPRMTPADGLLTGLGCAVDDDGRVCVDASGRTGVPGVWAVGNVVDPRAQLITAAGAASAAAIALHHDLAAEDTARAVERLRAGRTPQAISPTGA